MIIVVSQYYIFTYLVSYSKIQSFLFWHFLFQKINHIFDLFFLINTQRDSFLFLLFYKQSEFFLKKNKIKFKLTDDFFFLFEHLRIRGAYKTQTPTTINKLLVIDGFKSFFGRTLYLQKSFNLFIPPLKIKNKQLRKKIYQFYQLWHKWILPTTVQLTISLMLLFPISFQEVNFLVMNNFVFKNGGVTKNTILFAGDCVYILWSIKLLQYFFYKFFNYYTLLKNNSYKIHIKNQTILKFYFSFNISIFFEFDFFAMSFILLMHNYKLLLLPDIFFMLHSFFFSKQYFWLT